MEAIGFMLIGGLALAVWVATKIGIDHSREVCAEANLNGSMGERIRRAKEEWETMSEEEREAFLLEGMDINHDFFTSSDYSLVPGNAFYTDD